MQVARMLFLAIFYKVLFFKVMSYETVYVDETSVACDGGKGALGHPKVYLEIKPEVGEIVCPYCSRNFVLEGKKKKAGNK